MDDVLDALGDVQRRKLLVSLLAHNPQDDTPVIVGSDEEAHLVKDLIRMRHVHLPKLEEYGFIEWNRETHEVSKGPDFEEIRPILELLDAHEDELPTDWL